MKFLKDAKTAAFALAAISAAGFDLAAFEKSGDTNALKAAIDAKLAAAAPASGPTGEDMDKMIAANLELEKRVTGAEATAKTFNALCDALASNGIKVSESYAASGEFSPAKITDLFTLAVAKASRLALTRAGHNSVLEEIPEAAATKPEKCPEHLTGKDRVTWAMNRQMAKQGRN